MPRRGSRSPWVPSARGCWPWVVSGGRGRRVRVCVDVRVPRAHGRGAGERRPLTPSWKESGRKRKQGNYPLVNTSCGQGLRLCELPTSPSRGTSIGSPLCREGHSAGACARLTAGKQPWTERENEGALGGRGDGAARPCPSPTPRCLSGEGSGWSGTLSCQREWRGVDVLGSVCGVSGGKVAVSGDRADVSGGAHPAAASARCAPSGESGDPSPPSISLLCPRA